MGKIQDLQVTFGTASRPNPNQLQASRRTPLATYWTGDVIEGHVMIEVVEAVRVKCITAKLCGVARCSWQTGIGIFNQTHTARHELVQQERVLWRPGKAVPKWFTSCGGTSLRTR